MTTFTNQSKSSSSVQGFDLGTFDVAIFDMAGISFTEQDKSTSSFTNQSKN